MAKISIIVPVYNVESFLERSIKSLLNQTLQDIEVILVNDGSTDKSLEICEQFRVQDKRIKIINKSNEGVSIARNVGIKIASSEIITFMDPDDEVEDCMYEEMYLKMIKEKVDICICNFNEIKKEKTTSIMLPFREGIHGKKTINHLILSMIGGNYLEENTIMGCVWRSLFKKTIIDEYDILFPRNIRPMQDIIFMINYLTKSKCIYIDSSCYYQYYINPDSGVRVYKEDNWSNALKVYYMIEEILKEAKLLESAKERLKNRWLLMTLTGLINETHDGNKKKLVKKLKKMKEISENSITQLYIQQIDMKAQPLKRRIIWKKIKNKKILFIYFYYRIVRKIK